LPVEAGDLQGESAVREDSLLRVTITIRRAAGRFADKDGWCPALEQSHEVTRSGKCSRVDKDEKAARLPEPFGTNGGAHDWVGKSVIATGIITQIEHESRVWFLLHGVEHFLGELRNRFLRIGQNFRETGMNNLFWQGRDPMAAVGTWPGCFGEVNP